jgi:hypothetical protein
MKIALRWSVLEAILDLDIGVPVEDIANYQLLSD